MSELVFDAHHLGSVLRGEKHVTLRQFDLTRHDFDEGEQVVGRFVADGLSDVTVPLRITNGGTRVYRAKNLPVSQVQRDGFRTVDEAIAGLRMVYPGFNARTFTAVIQFEVAPQ